jgi:hypothetical protein
LDVLGVREMAIPAEAAGADFRDFREVLVGMVEY